MQVGTYVVTTAGAQGYLILRCHVPEKNRGVGLTAPVTGNTAGKPYRRKVRNKQVYAIASTAVVLVVLPRLGATVATS